jgi:predicted nucleotidyltransferase component of viral defense system
LTSDLTSLLTSRESLRTLIAANQRNSGFSGILLEKDFYLTVLLALLLQVDHELIFKGGTCLNKCYLGYYRLSEDLDFIHSNSGGKTRNVRRDDLQKTDELLRGIIDDLPGMTCGPAEKFDEHHQYRISINYDSLLIDNASIKLEVTHRHTLYKVPREMPLHHQFIHPVTGNPYHDTGTILSIDLEEAAAEKVRACLTRRNPAIRDFFDLWYIREHTEINMSDGPFCTLVQRKLQESEGIIDLDKSVKLLERQISEELTPTLNKEYPFNLKDTITFVLSFL